MEREFMTMEEIFILTYACATGLAFIISILIGYFYKIGKKNRDVGENE